MAGEVAGEEVVDTGDGVDCSLKGKEGGELLGNVNEGLLLPGLPSPKLKMGLVVSLVVLFAAPSSESVALAFSCDSMGSASSCKLVGTVASET